jgi:hypothetical protein
LALILNLKPLRFSTYFIYKLEVHLKFIVSSEDIDNKKFLSFEES